ncbi:hypothetical protein [Bradyrhizobium ottawaense]
MLRIFDTTSNTYSSLLYAKTAPNFFGPSALVVRADVALEQLRQQPPTGVSKGDGGALSPNGAEGVPTAPIPSAGSAKPHRFYGSVEIDMVRPVKSFDAILNAVILELQRTPGAKVKVTLEIEAKAPSGFDPSEVGIVRDNAKQLKFTPEATGFD